VPIPTARALAFALSFVALVALDPRGAHGAPGDPVAAPSRPLYLGMGVKVGEMTSASAIALVRLTEIPEQDPRRRVPGALGWARIRYGLGEKRTGEKATPWAQNTRQDDFSVQIPLSGLAPGSRYSYEVDAKRSEADVPSVFGPFSFVTAPAPDVRAPVHFQVTTCQDVCGVPVYDVMASRKPDFLVSTGDNVYYDSYNARTPHKAFAAYQIMYGQRPLVNYFRNIGGYFEKDDHDYRFDEADPYVKGRWYADGKVKKGAKITEHEGSRSLDVNWLSDEQGRRIFRTVFPMGPRTYRTFRWGKGVQIWLLEGRDFRSPNAMADGPDKTMWGAEQLAWLKQTLQESDADHRIIVSPTPIIGPDRTSKRDNQADPKGFWTEGQAFLDWVHEKGLSNVVIVAGDRHWQYESIDHRKGREIQEFGCGPTCDHHTQDVPPPYEGVETVYAARRGGFLSVRYTPGDRSLEIEHDSMTGEVVHTARLPAPPTP